jgi:hypothetical protein
VPSGATLATNDKSNVVVRTKPLVCVVSRAEEASGLMYDRCKVRVGAGREAGAQQLGVQQSGVQQSGVQQSGVQQSGVQQSGVQQSGVQQSGVQQTGVQQAGVQQAGVQQAGVQREKGGKRSLAVWKSLKPPPATCARASRLCLSLHSLTL